MPTSIWIALFVLLGTTWFLVRALRRPAKPEPEKPERAAPAGSVYGPPVPAPAPAPATGMRVMQMRSRGFLAIEGADGRREEPLPDSPLGHGDYPMGLWVADDHTAFVVGKQYTGQPGPDDGAVWRREADGAWSTAYRCRGRVFGDVVGRSRDEVVVAGMGGVFCFDGSRWRDVPLPYPQMWQVWLEDGAVVAQAFDGSVAFTIAGGVATACAPRPRPRRDSSTCTIDGVRYERGSHSEEVGERTLSAEEEREIRGELAQISRALER